LRNKPIRDALIRGAGLLGMHAVWRTSRANLASLIATLKPLECGKELIRVGPNGDGGYLVPDDLDGIAHAFSPCVSDESGFERELASRGTTVHLADYSVDGPAEAHPLFTFEKKFVGSFPSLTTMTMDEWSANRAAGYGGDLLLQMDIEGAEFETITNMSPELLARFRIMVIEFHYLHQLWNKPWFIQVARTFEKLLKQHSVVHIHPNNCCGSLNSRGIEIPRVAEFTFLRNDRFKHRLPQTSFPHPLDHDNTAKRPLLLPHCWYQPDDSS
jgi:hypothetical protein